MRNLKLLQREYSLYKLGLGDYPKEMDILKKLDNLRPVSTKSIYIQGYVNDREGHHYFRYNLLDESLDVSYSGVIVYFETELNYTAGAALEICSDYIEHNYKLKISIVY